MRFQRPCLQCNTLHRDPGDYCVSCRKKKEALREADPNRVARKRLLYGADYQLRRKKMIQETLERNLFCHLCEKPFERVADITADHLYPGNPNSPLYPAHLSCNSRRGNKTA
jgi:hypothetical protein